MMMRPGNPRPTRHRRRGGFTLPELMIATVMLAIIGSALMSMLVRQQRFYRGTGDLMDLRSQLRQASSAITSDLRGISTAGSDIVAMTDSSIDFRQTFGTSIICKVPIVAGASIILPPTSLASGAALTQWMSLPTTSDSIFVFDDDSLAANSDDHWQKFAVGSVTAAVNTCPSGSGYFTATGDATKNSYTIGLSGNIAKWVTAGAPVRFYRPAHYSLYKASDNRWYLGFCTYSCTGTNAISPVAGPFNAYSTTNSSSGLYMSYYNAAGTVTTTPSAVARIRIAIHGATQNPVNISGFSQKTVYDSMVTNVAIRNRT